MRVRLLRVLFTLTAFAVVWLMASRAQAASPNATTLPAFVSQVPASLASFVPRAGAPVPGRPETRAPLCDPRGAITFAPAPQMQDVEASLDTGLTLDDCMSTATGESRHASRAPAPIPADSWSAPSDVAVTTAVATLARASRELIPAPAESTSCSRPGFRSTVDRPPRV